MKQRSGFLMNASMVLLIFLAAALPVAAQAKDDEWHFIVAPYLVMASMDGTVAVRGVEVDVHPSVSDIFSNLQAGFQGYFAARKGNWGAGVDIIYMGLGTSTDYVNVDPSQGAFTFIAIRRLGPTLDLNFGARWNVIRGRLEFKDNAPPPLAGTILEQTKQWADPIVGINWHQPLGKHWQVGVATNIGGFGISSKIAVDAFPTIQYQAAGHLWLGGGWRFLYMDYESGYEDGHPVPGKDPFRYDVLTQGPVIGLVFRF